ncbi:MAG: FAD-binding protein [Litoreibacter sp.]
MTPKTEKQLCDAVRDIKGPLKIVGGGTRPIGNDVSGETLSTALMSGITLYEPGALTLVAQAGTPLADIEAALGAENQRLPFEPMDHRKLLGTEGISTIGGVVAANVSGPARIQAGACRDSLIGVRFVDGQGTAIKNGGRVMKNVTGYDLVKLLAGSYGTLGVLTEVSFKVLPTDATQACILIKNQSVAGAVHSMSQALGSPYEVSGAAHIMGDEPVTMLRIEGFQDSVAYRTEQLVKLLAAAGDISIENDPVKSGALWGGIRDVAPLHEFDGDIWRCSIKPSDAPALVAALADAKVVLDWGGGLVWIGCPSGTNLREVAPQITGHRTLMRGGDDTKVALGVFEKENVAIQKLSQGLRDRFDPRGILNPGLMG